MKKKLIIEVLAFLVVIGVSAQNSKPARNPGENLKLNLKNLKQIAEVDERYQSFNVEMCEVVGGKFWIPYELMDTTKGKRKKGGFDALKRVIPPIDLYEKKIRNLTSALGPTYIRVSGTWANTTYFQDNDEPALTTAPAGYENVLTRKEWKGVIDFCKNVDAKLVTSFAISNGMRDKEGNWTPAQMQPLINYTNYLGSKIAAAEMFNEPSHADHGGTPAGYNADYFARDFAAFKLYAKKAVPEMKILGPGSTGDGDMMPGMSITVDQIFTATPKPDFDIFAYHFYGGLSKRCFGSLTPENALTNEWLSRTELGVKPYEDARDKYQPGKEIWLTETAESACGGNKWAATYLDCFRYLEQLGRLAKRNVKVVMHNTLAASEYALLDQQTHEPRPNYWAALLWNKLMGTKVYNAETNVNGPDVFIHSLKGSDKGVAVLIVNPTEEKYSIEIPSPAKKYLFKSLTTLQSKQVTLNGILLRENYEGRIPKLKGNKIKAGETTIPAQSIMFLTFENI
jgi:hypothetical protein